LRDATVAITGEGRLDRQTSTGKAPAEVAARATLRDIPCIAIAGTVVDALPRLFSAALSLDSIDADVDPMRHTSALVRRAARRAIEDMRARSGRSGDT
jgi:glycerate 2-kinase